MTKNGTEIVIFGWGLENPQLVNITVPSNRIKETMDKKLAKGLLAITSTIANRRLKAIKTTNARSKGLMYTYEYKAKTNPANAIAHQYLKLKDA